ncbi:MAG: MFS transporter [Candidatus Levybacteria bacterium]|nr:MFS transporter [Candidatus Levybacteria bacterium]
MNSVQQKFWNLPFVILLLGALITVFNISVTNVAIPKIAAALSANGLQIHFIADGLTITLAAFVLLLGAIGDSYGRKLLFVSGCAIMIIASLFSAYSTSANTLIVWRMIAGIATAMLYPTTLSMITTIFQEKKQRLLAIGMWSGISAGGAALAPVVAGWLLVYFPWGSVFLISVPFTILALILGWWVLPEFKNKNEKSIDYLGGILSIIWISFLLFGIILFPVDGFDSRVGSALGIACVSLVLFLLRELHTTNPLLDLRVFKNSRFSIAALTITIVAFAQLGVMFLAQQYVQNVLGYNTLQAGLSGFPLSIAVLIASPLSAKIDGRFGSRKTIAAGFFFIAIGFLTALLWTVHSPYLQICLSYVLIGIGLGLTMTPSTNAIMNSLPEGKAGIASAVNDVTRDLGNSLGIAVNGSIAAISYTTVLEKMEKNIPVSEQAAISENIVRTITSSLSGALEVAQRYPSVNAGQMVSAAKQAFLDGQLAAMLLSAILCFIGAIIVLLYMPQAPSQEKKSL